jgi:hypothetical protein
MLESEHLHTIFSEVCSKTKDLVGDQLAAVTSRKGKEPKVSPRTKTLTNADVCKRPYFLRGDLGTTSTLHKSSNAASATSKSCSHERRKYRYSKFREHG